MSEKSNILTINVKATEIDEVKDIISQFIFMLEDTRIDRDIREQYLESCKFIKDNFYVNIVEANKLLLNLNKRKL